MGRVRAYVGLGANVGDAAGDARGRGPRARGAPRVGRRGVSRLYATEPVGVVDQPEFRNAVVALDVPGRRRTRRPAPRRCSSRSRTSSARSAARPRERWGPREVDLDLLRLRRRRIEVERPPAGRSDDPAKAAAPAGRAPRGGAQPAVRARAARRPGARARAARLGRDGRRRRRAPPGASRARTPSAPIATWDGEGWGRSASALSADRARERRRPRRGAARANRAFREVRRHQAPDVRVVATRPSARTAGSADRRSAATATLQP